MFKGVHAKRSAVVSMSMNCLKFNASQCQKYFERKKTSNFLLNKNGMKGARAECVERAW